MVKESGKSRAMRPALTDDARESQLVSMAIDLAAKQIQDGTASSQVITHFLKLGTQKEKLEREKIKHENTLLQAKANALESQKKTEEMFQQAIAAMKTYSGKSGVEEEIIED